MAVVTVAAAETRRSAAEVAAALVVAAASSAAVVVDSSPSLRNASFASLTIRSASSTGKPEPRPKNSYRLVPVEEYTEDPVLQTLIRMVAAQQIDPAVAQAATWHIANGMSWRELAAKKYDRVAAPDVPYFNRAQLFAAQSLVSVARSKAEEAAGAKPEPAAIPDRTRRSVR